MLSNNLTWQYCDWQTIKIQGCSLLGVKHKVNFAGSEGVSLVFQYKRSMRVSATNHNKFYVIAIHYSKIYDKPRKYYLILYVIRIILRFFHLTGHEFHSIFVWAGVLVCA